MTTADALPTDCAFRGSRNACKSKRPPKKQEPAEGGAPMVCADCGAPVSKAQAQMSMMFVSRPLCKTCLDRLKSGGRKYDT